MKLFLNSEERYRLGNFNRIAEELQEVRQVLLESKREARSLLELAKGCHRHSGYRAIMKPTAECTRCQQLFDMANHLRSIGVRGLERSNAKKPKLSNRVFAGGGDGVL